MRVPERADAHVLVRLEARQQLRSLPVPDEELTVGVTGDQVTVIKKIRLVLGIIIKGDLPHVWGECRLTGIPCDHMSREDLLLVELEAIHARKGLYLIVHTLTGEPLAVGGGSYCRYRMHRRVGDVLDVHGNVPVPNPQGLVIGSGDKLPSPINQGHRIDGAQMPVILLADVARPCVPAEDLFVGHARQEVVSVGIIGDVKLDAVGDLPVGELTNAGARLRVPELEEAVVAGGDEAVAVPVEADVPDGRFVAVVGHHGATLVVDFPELYFGVHGAAEEEVSGHRKEADGRQRLRVARVRVKELLREKTPAGGVIGSVKWYIDVVWWVEEGTALVVVRVLDVEDGLLLELLLDATGSLRALSA